VARAALENVHRELGCVGIPNRSPYQRKRSKSFLNPGKSLREHFLDSCVSAGWTEKSSSQSGKSTSTFRTGHGQAHRLSRFRWYRNLNRSARHAHCHADEGTFGLALIPALCVTAQRTADLSPHVGHGYGLQMIQLFFCVPFGACSRMTAKRAKGLFVAHLCLPVLKQDLELKATFRRRAFPVVITVIIDLYRN
jgi:hypothetical protein